MSDSMLVGTRKGLFQLRRSARDEAGWEIERTAFLGDPVTMVLAEPGGERIHAALDHGHFGVKLQRSEDWGRTWKEAATPSYPEKPEGLEDLDPMRGEPVPWSLKLIWSLEGAHAAAPQELWCGTMPGGLFRSGDGGESWELVRTLWEHPARKSWFGGGADYPGIHTILVDPRDPMHVTVAVSCGGVWASADGAETWEPRTEGMWAAYMPPELRGDPSTQDPHRLALCPADPDTVWAQHHNGIFRSRNGGRSWAEIENVSPSSFGFAVAVHPEDPDTAWFVPAEKDEKRFPVDGKVIVTRTRDGGESFDVLRQGLPQSHAYDLTFRHCLDVDDTGESLAFGTTTGSLWSSDDQGERWKQISTHLPPIYCLRFVD